MATDIVRSTSFLLSYIYRASFQDRTDLYQRNTICTDQTVNLPKMSKYFYCNEQNRRL